MSERAMTWIAPVVMFLVLIGGLWLVFGGASYLRTVADAHREDIGFALLVSVYFIPLSGAAAYHFVNGYKERERWRNSRLGGNPGYEMGVLLGGAALGVLILAIVAATAY